MKSCKPFSEIVEAGQLTPKKSVQCLRLMCVWQTPFIRPRSFGSAKHRRAASSIDSGVDALSVTP